MRIASRLFTRPPMLISRKISSPITTEHIRPEPLLHRQRDQHDRKPDDTRMLRKVLLLSASAGAGHIRAAEAIEKAFNQEPDADVREVRHIDVLNYTNKLFRHLYSKAYIDLVNKMPEVPGWVYDKLDKPWKNERRRLALDKLNTRPFVKLLREYQPNLIVCTHFLPAEVVSWLKAKERLASRQVIIVTDFDVHAMWLVHHYERYFVAVRSEERRVG